MNISNEDLNRVFRTAYFAGMSDVKTLNVTLDTLEAYASNFIGDYIGEALYDEMFVWFNTEDGEYLREDESKFLTTVKELYKAGACMAITVNTVNEVK
jgi:hypothetical protein